ncbi:MAG: serine/threonine-protein kinase [Vicinamibacterales bacterium]
MHTDPVRWARIEALLDAALDLPPGERHAHVIAACGDDADLARDVLALVDADARADGFLDTPTPERLGALLEGGADPDVAVATGRSIGAYRVTGVLGQGGMGVVYEAVRADGQFEQTVAIKVMRWAGTDAATRQRFLRERQILASLAHPHIARLLDGGVTDDGLPYFVMERVVPGTPVTQWCESRGLDVPARLALMLQACDAVQFAHRRLVVHRDLKPSNILVDQNGDVKLADFGIAKLLADDEAPFATRTDARPLTPAYAAPEQVTGGEITTATDVYGLGVVLYVALTGRLPYDVETTRATDWARAITDTAPLRPSLAVHEPRLRARLAGDLDRIVLKALEKEPSRRYVSIEALADDLRRHLDGRPVLAHEPSRWYRLRKFAGRNRALVGAAAALLLTLTVGLAATAWQARIARAQAARAEAVQQFLVSIFQQADPDRERGVELTAKQILANGTARIDTEFAAQPDVRVSLWDVVHELQSRLGDYRAMEEASRRQAEAAAQAFGTSSREYGHAMRQLANALLEVEQPAAAKAALEIAMPILARTAGERSDEMVEALTVAGGVALTEGRRADDIAAHRRALAIAGELYGVDSAEAARIENDLIVAIGSSPEALERSAHVSAVYGRAYGTESYLYTLARYNEGFQLYDAGRWSEALARFREVAPIQEKLLGATHPKTALTYRQLARVAAMEGDFTLARRMMDQAIAALSAQYGGRSTAVALAQGQLANVARLQGRYAEAIDAGRAALRTFDGTGDAESNRALILDSLGSAQRDAGDVSGAIATARAAVRISEGPDPRFLGQNLTLLGSALGAAGQWAEACVVLSRAIANLKDAHLDRTASARWR